MVGAAMRVMEQMMHACTINGVTPAAIVASVPESPTDHIQARLDLQELDRALEFYFQNGLASSTQKAYNYISQETVYPVVQ